MTVQKKNLAIKAVLGVVLIAGLALIAAFLFEFINQQKWLLSDAQTLQPYRYVLFEGGQPITLPSSMSPEERSIAAAVMQYRTGRDVLLTHLSVSPPRFNIWGTRAYAKVYMVTDVAGLPPGEQRGRKLKAVYTFANGESGEWAVVKTQDKTIE